MAVASRDREVHRARCEGTGCLTSTPMNRRIILGDMKASYVLSFLCGAAVMLGFSTLSGAEIYSKP
jgi:hypothetical protein